MSIDSGFHRGVLLPQLDSNCDLEVKFFGGRKNQRTRRKPSHRRKPTNTHVHTYILNWMKVNRCKRAKNHQNSVKLAHAFLSRLEDSIYFWKFDFKFVLNLTRMKRNFQVGNFKSGLDSNLDAKQKNTCRFGKFLIAKTFISIYCQYLINTNAPYQAKCHQMLNCHYLLRFSKNTINLQKLSSWDGTLRLVWAERRFSLNLYYSRRH